MKQNMTHYQFYIPRYTQAGFSLVEIMIASLIGIFIMGGGIAIHVSTKQPPAQAGGFERYTSLYRRTKPPTERESV